MTVLWIALGFLCGFGVAGFLAYKVYARYEADRKLDPWVNPSSLEAARLKEAAEEHLRRYILVWPDVENRPKSTQYDGVNALKALTLQEGVIYFNKGIATLPDGSQTALGPLAIKLLEMLNESYANLDAASSLITDYATLFHTFDELAVSENEHLRRIAGHGDMYPFQWTLVRLAELLGIDPDKNDVGVGGAVLWERIRRWHNQKAMVILTNGFQLDCPRCFSPFYDIQKDPRGSEHVCKECEETFHVPTSAKFLCVDEVNKAQGNNSEARLEMGRWLRVIARNLKHDDRRDSMSRKSPNPESKLLAGAVVGGAGMGMPGIDPPEGMGAVLLFVPLSEMTNKTIFEIQADLGIRWHMEGGPGVWLDEM